MYRWKTGITRCNYWFIRLIILKTCLHIHNRLFKQCCVVILHNCVVSYLMQNVWSSSIALRQKNYHIYVAKLHRSEILLSLVQVYHSQFVYKIRSNIFNWNSIMIINCYKIHIWRTQKSVWTTLTRDGNLQCILPRFKWLLQHFLIQLYQNRLSWENHQHFFSNWEFTLSGKKYISYDNQFWF